MLERGPHRHQIAQGARRSQTGTADLTRRFNIMTIRRNRQSAQTATLPMTCGTQWIARLDHSPFSLHRTTASSSASP